MAGPATRERNSTPAGAPEPVEQAHLARQTEPSRRSLRTTLYNAGQTLTRLWRKGTELRKTLHAYLEGIGVPVNHGLPPELTRRDHNH